MRVSHHICKTAKYTTRRVTDMTSDEHTAVVTAANAAIATRNRAERDKRLAACDWVVTKALEAGGSVPSAWVTYRTALRDITGHSSWPNLYTMLTWRVTIVIGLRSLANGY